MFQIETQAVGRAAVAKTGHARGGQQKRGVVVEGDGRQRFLRLLVGVKGENGARFFIGRDALIFADWRA
ncbi:hypothetical protein [Candidatus Amarolinea dominans]|uniref:hypothetical protein n=1 Tax=Candidatus Amarolinea dominans TaxID=3140696 RepID=UPI0031CC6FB3